ncbi:E3 ubiquitin/ISG15 ligase TRIM25 isoform X2 [Hyperolius riggenbachi]|uniref:E3 ubiquitin/ISG15 ligase TRIM25 isoform X2 n=1 Tax=Hyperolius riggenbachi TaxID=752182 RepID=UPI0035A39CAF
MAQSLEEMAEELTCSICLCLFSTPVTIPCGHNFCSSCLELTWKDPDQGVYTCPQCRYSFSSKPELRKNTLLSNLVNLAQAARGEETTSDPELEETKSDEEPEEEEEKEGTLLCDSCRKAAAAKTCLTCMASFCLDHLLPHQQSPVFADHQLIQPIGDLQKRKCSEHNKLIDHYCWEHSKCICCYCALTHKVCQTYTLEEGKKKKEQYYTSLLRALNQKIDKATNVTEEVQFEQRKKMENTTKKKELLEAEFEEIKALIEEEQKKALAKIDLEEKKLNGKVSYTQNVLRQKKREFEFVRNKVQSLLQEEDDLQFLKRATKLKDTTSKEPFKPRLDLDEKLLHSVYRNALSLKENIKSKINSPEESQDWRPRKAPDQGSAPEEWRPRKVPDQGSAPEEWRQRKAPEPGSMPEPDRSSKWKPGPPQSPHKPEENSKQDKQPKKHKPKPSKPFANPPPAEAAAPPPHAKPRAPRASSAAPLESRDQLLKYAERISVNPQTAHKKIALFDNFTRMAVSDIPQNYGDNPHSSWRSNHTTQSRRTQHSSMENLLDEWIFR